jgi:hypothetical protein
VYLKTKKDYQNSKRETEKKNCLQCRNSDITQLFAVTRIRTWVVAATTRSTNHYTITAMTCRQNVCGKNWVFKIKADFNMFNTLSVSFWSNHFSYKILTRCIYGTNAIRLFKRDSVPSYTFFKRRLTALLFLLAWHGKRV